MSSSFQLIPQLQAKRGVLFVEGETEQAFVERLKLSHLGWFVDINVDSYRGEGSRRLARIEMLLERFVRQGYKVFIQGDADGGSTSIFTNLIQKGLVDEENTFAFTMILKQQYRIPYHIKHSNLWVFLMRHHSMNLSIKLDMENYQWLKN